MTISYDRSATQTGAAVAYDEGLRAYMLRVYNYMASALLLTGVTAYATANFEPLHSLFYKVQDGMLVGYTGLGLIVAFAPLALVFLLGFRIQKMQFSTAQAVFWGYSALMGLSLASLFFLYTGESLARVFFITAATFGGMSLYGYTTHRDLTGWGSFLFMGVIGIVIASLVNLFIQSTALYYAVSVIGVLIFVGLTAYDTQRIKSTYYQLGGHAAELSKAALMGALSLYLDFINLFIMLLRLFGERR